MEHTYRMLTTKESGVKNAQSPAQTLEVELRFISQNQQLEGFSGEISEAARQYRPNLEELQAVSKKFGAQVPQSKTPAKG